MKEKFQAILLFIMIATINYGCKKENSCEACDNKNKPPVSIAGNDIFINLPTDSILLDGSASNDPDGNINEWHWTKISGPLPITITNTSIAKTVIKNLSEGIYQIELTVKDNQGLSAKDTMRVFVNKPGTNQPPVARAGSNQSITLPTNIVSLDGSSSTDPDNNITSYTWLKISGPSFFSISNINAVQPQVSNLVEGIYQFELKVTDAGGLFSTDTVQVIINPITSSFPGCVIPGSTEVGRFSGPRVDMASVMCNNKFYFAASSIMEIFDPATGTVATHSLSLNREHIAAASSGNTAFFAGGYIYPASTTTPGTIISRIDIYNTDTRTWNTAELSIARFGICTGAIGNKVFFAGGIIDNQSTVTARVDVYDMSTNSWSHRELSQAGRFVSVIIENKIWFVTHSSNKIDVYDPGTDSWSTLLLSFPVYDNLPVFIYNHTAITINNKVYFTGNRVIKVFDIPSNSWTSLTLSENKFYIPAAISNNKIAFIGGMTSWFVYSNLVEIYDPAANSWSILFMSSDLFYSSFVSYNNYIYSAGGLINQENNSLSGICRFQL